MDDAPLGTVAIVGLGYVGLSLARELAGAGLVVRGVDISQAKVDVLRAGASPLSDLTDSEVQTMLRQGFSPSTDFSVIAQSATVILALPTPLGLDNQPDLGPLLTAAADAAPFAFDGQLWILESTVSPGVTEGELLDVLLRRAPSSGRDILLSFSPERVDPGSAGSGLTSIPKIVAGRDQKALRAAAAFYRKAGFSVVESASIRAAEAAKLLENTYRAVNIALINELVQLVSVAGIDFHEVVRLAETKPFGFQAFWPGPGVGGHCIPIDPWYLQSFLGLSGEASSITNVALKINSEMPKMTARKIYQTGLETGILGKKSGNVTLLGMAYKADVDDFRGAPGPDVVEELVNLGISVSYHDPFLRSPLPGVGGDWVAGDFSPQKIEAMTVVIQNHDAYRSSLNRLRGSELLFSAASGRDQLATSIWEPSAEA